MSNTYTLEDLSQMSGISTETLQYYDQYGLLIPAEKREQVSLYEESQLLDLQQIMLLREEGLPLSRIKVLVEEKKHPKEALLLHKNRLIEKQQRIQSLMDTIDYTINYIQQGNPIKHQRLYEGFDLTVQDEYSGMSFSVGVGSKPTMNNDMNEEQSQQQWTKDDYLNTQREADQIYLELCNAMESGYNPDSPFVQKIIKRHYEWLSHFYTPTKEIYGGLGDMYVEHEDFKQLYAGYHPKLAEFLRDGMKIYAAEHM